jgi:hypothetical protein
VFLLSHPPTGPLNTYLQITMITKNTGWKRPQWTQISK